MPKRPKRIRILLTGGGTGGHIYPLVAVAEELNKQVNARGFDADIRYFGDAGDFKNQIESRGIKIAKITPSKLRRYFDLQNFLDIFRFIFGVIQSLWKIFWFMPHVAFSKGGPGSLAVISACRFYFVPLVIHESDAIPGITNRISAKAARLIELAFVAAKDYFPAKKPMHLVGNPVREEITRGDSDPIVKGEFGFDPQKPVIFFIGGSQGAEKLNEFVFENIETLTQKYQVIHQIGPKNFTSYANEFNSTYKNRLEDLKKRYVFAPYFENNLNKVYGASDLIVARAGSGLIFEAAALGKPAILVPLPESANNHQVANAYEYEKTGAALVVEQENLLPGVLIAEIEKILKSGELYKKMSEAAKKFYIPDSAQMIANNILGLILK
ncbi:MAG TPA: UDP-N-acetylglucosamine--N-acetylmuramyl-(pentapeptide) pyrophosphoryl-undecaprenol N-acetylglucosamine transferase [Candidatus Paceibacterota bacterium]